MALPDNNHTAIQNTFDRVLDEGVAVILETGSFESLHRRLSELFVPLAAAIVAGAGESADDDQIAAIARGMATHAAFDLWNHTPIPENRFRPRSIARPERNAPCVCGSGLKYKQCCGAVESPGLILPPDEMAARVLQQYPRERIGEIAALRMPVQTLGMVASRWTETGRSEDVIALLEPVFADVGSLDARAEHAADVLLNVYLDRGDEAARNRLLDKLRRSQDKTLVCVAYQRDAVRAADLADFPQAWAAFNAAQRLTPNNPALSHLEVLILLHEGRTAEARARADFWIARLSRDPDYDHSDLIEMLRRLTSAEGQRMLADAAADAPLIFDPVLAQRLSELPMQYSVKRLVLHVELCDIDPPVWRRIEVENTLTFADLHVIVQEAMGWQDCHLYEFVVGDVRLQSTDTSLAGGSDHRTLPDDMVALGQLLNRRKYFGYVYDFGDDWRHRITVEQRLPTRPHDRPAALIDGARACPPEDCGGVPGYCELLDAFTHPRRRDSRERLEWARNWKPDHLDLRATAKRVEGLFRRID